MASGRGRGGRLRRVLAVLAALWLGAGLLALDPDRAYACSCVGMSTRTAYERADVVFLGTLTSKASTGWRSERRTELRFKVSRAYKGSVYAEQVVRTPPDPAACGLDPELGSSWVVFGVEGTSGRGDSLVRQVTTGLCAGNLPTGSAPRELGRGRPPLPGPSDREEASIRADAAVTRGLTVGAITVLGLATLAGAALGVLWRPRQS